ncbi:MAG: hypothetical protein ACKO01_04800 [Erythrobacter sp.]
MTRRLIAPLAALAALASAQAAQAQQQACVAAGDLADAVTYALPLAYDGVRTTCTNRLTRKGFIATRGDAYMDQFRSRQNKAWPGAFRVLKTFMAGEDEGKAGTGGSDITELIAGMPDTAVRPFVDSLIGQMVAEEIKPADCGKIERGLEVLSPMPADDLGPLVGFLFEVSGMKNPEICAANAATPKR